MIKSIKAPWCNWPNQKYARDIEDLFKTGIRCDAWRKFFRSETVEKLKKVKGYVVWFNRYESFDKLICEFDCSEKKLRLTIESLMRPRHKRVVAFIRNDIYDSRAWASLPLSCFTEIKGCNERGKERVWQCDILKKNEMPVIQFGIKLPWIVSRSCFTLTHRLREHDRKAMMTFSHPQLDYRFNNKRWAGEKVFSREATREEMTKVLFAQVEKRCAKYLVIIVD